MPFDLVEEHVMLRDLVAKFVDNELMPLEKAVMAREAAGGEIRLTEEELNPLLDKCRELGLWALDAPEEAGGMNLPAVALVGVNEELGRTITPFVFPPDSPNLHMLLAVADERQKRLYMEPYASGEAHSAIAISEPGAGGDPAGMSTRAVKDGDHWVIDGRKIWISRVALCRLHHRHGAHRPGKTRARRHHRLHRREGHARLHRRARNPDAGRPAHL